eukprot:EG_transcript_49
MLPALPLLVTFFLLSILPSVAGTCVDTPGWIDSRGWTCANYSPYCTRGGGYSAAYDLSTQLPFEHFAASGRSAFAACCACGANRDVVDCITVPLYATTSYIANVLFWQVAEARGSLMVAGYTEVARDPYRTYRDALCLLPGNYTLLAYDTSGGFVQVPWGNDTNSSVSLVPGTSLNALKALPFPVPTGSGQCYRDAVQCPGNATCFDTVDGHYCECAPGFEMVNGMCTDSDECTLGVFVCASGATCINTVGFYNCTCPDGYFGDGRTFCVAPASEQNSNVAGCTTIQVDVFTANYSLEMGWRIDGTLPAVQYWYGYYTQPLVQARPVYPCLLPGSYTLRARDLWGDGWDSGWIHVHIGGDDLVPNGTVAANEQTWDFEVPETSGECFASSGTCSPNATCIDDGFTCTCNSPYAGDGLTCGNPCASSPCGANEACVNDNATQRHCDCLSGYDNSGGSCVDIDECLTPDTCDALATCVNTPGSYTCVCGAGYYGYDGLAYDTGCTARTRNVSGCISVAVHIWTDDAPDEISWDITGAVPPMYADGITYTQNYAHFIHSVCLLPGSYTFMGLDSYGDGWSDGGFMVYYGDTVLVPFTQVLEDETDMDFIIPNGTSFCHDANFPCSNGLTCVDTPTTGECICGNPSCVVCTTFELRVTTDNNPLQMSWYISQSDGKVALVLDDGFMVVAHRDYLFTKCLPAGNYTVTGTDSFGDGWTTGGFRLDIGSRSVVPPTAVVGYDRTVAFALPSSSGSCGRYTTRKACSDTVEMCVDTAVDQTCQCRPGMVNQSGTCADIDECQAGTHNCNSNATCTNVVGYFLCSCNPGFRGDGRTCYGPNRDVAGCTQLTVQINTGQYPSEMGWSIVEAFPDAGVPVGSYSDEYTLYEMTVCLLPGRYTFQVYDSYGDGWDNGTFAVQYGIRTLIEPTEVTLYGFGMDLIVPEEINECEVGSDNCNVNAVCTNVVSTFQCTCNDGYTGNGVWCNGPADAVSCVDLVGWRDINNFTCSDYEQAGWCADWWYGPAWDYEWGLLEDFKAPGSVGADQACCACGMSRSPVQPVDCVVRAWGAWSDCIAVDEVNCSSSRQRAVRAMPSLGGAPCPPLFQTAACDSCPHCIMGDWSNWECHVRGQQIRTRSPTSAPQGSLCGDLGAAQFSFDCSSAPDVPEGYLGQTFGANDYGQLGLGDTTSRRTPEFALAYPFGLPIQQLRLGGDHSAAIAGWLLFTWGRNDYGQLGLGDKSRRTTPKMVVTPHGHEVRYVTAGGFHTAVILGDGTLWTFGRNDFGQLGRKGDRTQPRQMLIPGSFKVRKVALGRLHTVIIVRSGLVYVCGSDRQGQLGLEPVPGSPTNKQFVYATPVLVPLFVKGGRNVTQIAAGDTHTGFLTSLGELYYTGSSLYNQVGLGDSPDNPRLFMNSTDIRSIAAGSYHNAILMRNNSLFMFGRNDQGQLGNSTGKKISTAVPLLAATDATVVALGAFHSAYLSTRLELMVFGSNAEGQLGLNRTMQVKPVPLTSSFGGRIQAFSLGGAHTSILRAATVTPTLTVTATHTASQTGTLTSTPTPTPVSALCDQAASNRSLADSTVGLSLGSSCVLPLKAGSGSSDWQTRTLVLTIGTLQGSMSVLLTEGCTTGCAFTFTSADQGTTQRIKLPSGSSLGLLFTYSTPTTTAARHRTLLARAGSSPSAAVTMTVEYEGTAALLAIAAACATVLALLLAGTWLWLHYRWTHRPSRPLWKANRRMEPWWPRLCIAGGLGLLMAGVSYFIIAAATSKPVGPVALLAAGGAVAGVGFLLLALVVPWVSRDPTAHHCYGCGKKMRKWRFLGTYLPPLEEGSDVPRKAHTKCTRCVQCHKPAVTNGWAEAPPQRPYHARCWDELCSSIVQDPTFAARWLGLHSSEVTETELAHMLAVAVQHSAAAVIHQLLSVSPNLPSVPVAQERGSTAMHLAARTGNLPILCQLLQTEPYCLDPACAADPSRPPSVAIRGLEDANNDIFIVQPFVTYNDRPLYVGTDHGRYIYFYDPAEDTGKHVHTPGWCLSSHLGSGSNPLRLPIPDPLKGLGQSTEADSKGKAGRRKWHQRLTRGRGRGKTETQETQKADTVLTTSFNTEPLAVTPEDLNMEWVPHSTSLLEEAIRSGDQATIDHVKRLYQLQDPGCLLWKWHTGHGLWHTFSPAAQGAIHKAVAEGANSCTLELGRFAADPATLNFEAMQLTTHKGQEALRSCMRTVFQYPDSLTDKWVPTSDAKTILNWQQAVVVFTPGHVSFAAPNLDTLSYLCADGIVDYSLWQPPSKIGSRRPQVQSASFETMFKDVFRHEVTAVMGLASTVVIPRSGGGGGFAEDGKGRGRGADTGIGNRLTDGLEAPQSNQGVVFYPPGYSSDLGCLPYCSQLPDNSAGYLFELEPIIEMAADTLMKVHEMQRQLSRISPRHVVAVFVYTYELTYPQEGFDQIYAAMNKAMRLRQADKIEFWRPLIWEIDMALLAFPGFKGKCYRGINCKIDPAGYQTGTKICWPSFSSASQNLAVAEEFSKGEEGTLFFLSSTGARPINAVSRFPEEAEVLFPSNTVFVITSTLFSQSEIGAFYGRVDNVAMTQCGGEVANAVQKAYVDRPILVGHTSYVLHVPSDVSSHIIDLLGQAGVQVLESLEPHEGVPDIAAELVLVPNESDGSEQPWPTDLFPTLTGNHQYMNGVW